MIFFCSLKGLEISILQKEGTITTRRKGDFLGTEPNQDTGHLAPIIFCAIDSPSAFWQVIYSPLILCAAAVSRDNNRSLHHGANVRVSVMVSAQLLHNVLVGWRDYCPQTLPGSCLALWTIISWLFAPCKDETETSGLSATSFTFTETSCTVIGLLQVPILHSE